MTVACADLTDYGKDPVLENEALTWKDPPAEPRDYSMVRPASDPFQPDGGMKLLTGNLGRCIMKTSAVDPSHWTIEAPVRVFSTQERSEEHTSELQSLMRNSYAVFSLKKKK